MKIRFLTIATVISALFLVGCWGKSDADLQKASADKLKADTTTSGVTVSVKDGVATITGEVADDAAKAKAEANAKTEGIKSVVNNVTVKPPPPAASAPDTELKGKVEEAIKKAGGDGITVEVKDGVVTLRGSIAKDKLAGIMKAAQETKPKKVDNQLQVK
ncbi:MAG: BON domain-containing protein [Pyrinomonadaceae bacterium]|nr:BON domain-containing protein [Pyrinomonadaceae bacterium]